MKKIFFALLFSSSVWANYYDDSTNMAKHFCGNNSECIDIISLELDSAYYAGKEDIRRKNANPVNLVKNKKKKLSSLCDKAPNEELCLAYKASLLNLYIRGLSSQ